MLPPPTTKCTSFLMEKKCSGKVVCVPSYVSAKWWNSAWFDFRYACICQSLLIPSRPRCHLCSHFSKNILNILSFVKVSSFPQSDEFSPFYNIPYPHLFCLLFAYVVLFCSFSISVAPQNTPMSLYMYRKPLHYFWQTDRWTHRETETHICVPQFSELSGREPFRVN